MRRMWINQPSTLHPHHDLHGTLVLAGELEGSTRRVWFLYGDVMSQNVLALALSPGWPKHLRRRST